VQSGAAGDSAAGKTRVAVVDLGSNSTRLLVAEIADGHIEELERRSEVTGLGRGVDLSRQLAAEAIEEVCAVVGAYIETYSPLGVDVVAPIATSAVRDASNGSAFVAELRERFGLNARLLRGDEEAGLTYRGATAGRDRETRTLVVDIGGGSTELTVGRGPEVSYFTSLQVGVVRYSERHIHSDPPSAEELEELAQGVHDEIAATTDAQHPLGAEVGIAVAGTPTSLAAIDLGMDAYVPERVHGHRLAIETIQRICSELASKPLAERERVPGLQSGRAPTIVAGVVILIQVMRAFGLSEIEVSEHDIMHGAALEAAEKFRESE
jgi:exopolyphosphatase/guanosine-5'-triphosphate,3'-diphosphate pyrophosphatase